MALVGRRWQHQATKTSVATLRRFTGRSINLPKSSRQRQTPELPVKKVSPGCFHHYSTRKWNIQKCEYGKVIYVIWFAVDPLCEILPDHTFGGCPSQLSQIYLIRCYINYQRTHTLTASNSRKLYRKTKIRCIYIYIFIDINVRFCCTNESPSAQD